MVISKGPHRAGVGDCGVDIVDDVVGHLRRLDSLVLLVKVLDFLSMIT